MSKTIVTIAVVVLLGVAAAWALLRTPEAPASETSAEAPVDLLAYPRGPHGARLLSAPDLQLEMTIYETGVPPHFRIYPLGADLEPIAPSSVTLAVELHRLGGRVDRMTFTPEADYMRSNETVEEPHSFDVTVAATRNGQTRRWSYSQIEGKVQLGEAQLKSAGITIQAAGPRDMVTSFELPGEVKADDTKYARVVPRLQGVITSARKKEGDRVRRGEVLAVLDSRELASAKTDYLKAAHHVEFTRTALAREESLWRKKIAAEREYLEARREFDEALLGEKLASQQLVVLGVPPASIERLSTAAPETMARYEIRSPLNGVVLERQITVGEAVTADQAIFTVADLSSVWVELSVYAKDLANVREGQAATVVSADLGQEANGRISYLGPLVGQETRSAVARIVLPNPGTRWRPGLFVTTRLVKDTASVPIAVTADAIQTFRDWQVVFVRYGDSFEARPLELGRSDGTWVEVLSGLTAGERYASANSFAVKAEIGKLGATHDH